MTKMRFIQALLLIVVIQLAFSCKKEQMNDPNEVLVGEWILVKTFSETNGIDTSDNLKKTKWKIMADGKLKIYKNGIKHRTESWQRDYKIFYGQYIDSTQTFVMDTVQAITISNQGTKPFYITGDELLIYDSYIDGMDLYFERKN
jgi:hypothetical protein